MDAQYRRTAVRTAIEFLVGRLHVVCVQYQVPMNGFMGYCRRDLKSLELCTELWC